MDEQKQQNIQLKIVLVNAPVRAVFIWLANIAVDDTTIRQLGMLLLITLMKEELFMGPPVSMLFPRTPYCLVHILTQYQS